jgi:hypothetical protein
MYFYLNSSEWCEGKAILLVKPSYAPKAFGQVFNFSQILSPPQTKALPKSASGLSALLSLLAGKQAVFSQAL